MFFYSLQQYLDLAEIYGVETKRINEAVKNNPDKFPDSSPKPEKKNIFFTSGPTLIKYDPENKPGISNLINDGD